MSVTVYDIEIYGQRILTAQIERMQYKIFYYNMILLSVQMRYQNQLLLISMMNPRLMPF